jgi:hypothetical protein
MRKKGGAAASTSERAVRLSNAKSTKRQSRHLHLDGVHGVDRSGDFRTGCFVDARLNQFSIDWQSDHLAGAQRGAAVNAKLPYWTIRAGQRSPPPTLPTK